MKSTDFQAHSKGLLRYLTPASEGVAILLWCYLVKVSVRGPIVEWDSWSYHLPFASYLWDIGEGRQGYVPPLYIQLIYRSFPLFGEWLQGALWRVSGDVRWASLINILSLGGLMVLARKWIGVRMLWTLIGSLTYPLIALHAVSTYKDLFVGALIVLVVVSAARIVELYSDKGQQVMSSWAARTPWLIFSMTAIAVSNTKLQAWLLIVPILAWSFFSFMQTARGRLMRGRILAAALLILLACSLTQLRNFQTFGNPIFPLRLKFSPLSVQVDPSLGIYADPEFSASVATTPDYAGHNFLSQVIYFPASITEIDWWIRGVSPLYTLDMSKGGQQHGRQFRTGGMWGLYVVLNLILLIVMICRIRRSGVFTPEEVFLLRSFFLLTMLMLLMPRSHELRYMLAWPLLLTVANGVLIGKASRNFQMGAITLLLGLFAISQTTLRIERSIFTDVVLPATQAEWRKTAPPSLISRIREGSETCFDASEAQGRLWFRVSAAIVGGTHRITSPVDYDQSCATASHDW